MEPDKKISEKKVIDLLEPIEPFVSNLKTLEERWNWFLGIGVTLMVLGLLAIVGAQVASVLTILFVGIMLIAGSITKFIAAFWAGKWGGFWLSLLVGVLYGVTGFICITRPLEALSAITLLMSALFLISGLSKSLSSLYLRFENWGWVFFSGLISLLLGVLILAGWPASSLWVIGTFLGVDLLMSGWVWIALATESRRIAKERGHIDAP